MQKNIIIILVRQIAAAGDPERESPSPVNGVRSYIL